MSLNPENKQIFSHTSALKKIYRRCNLPSIRGCYHDATTVEKMTDVPAARRVFDTNFFAREPLVDL